MQIVVDIIQEFLNGQGITGRTEHIIELLISLVIILIVCFIVNFITKKILLKAISKILAKTKTKWDDVLLEKKVFDSLAHIAPALVIIYAAPAILQNFQGWIPLTLRLGEAYIVGVIMMVIVGFLNALEHLLKHSDTFKDKPIASYFQLAKIINYSICGVLILSIVLDVSPLYFLSAFGAVSAIVLLIFKDTILGFVASIQLSANNMVNVGDWVQMDKYGADGDIIMITLNTVKVRNWDNTITTIPTYAFVSDSFKNWRGMQDSGGRRISRAIHIDIHSIQFMSEEKLSKLNSIQLVAGFLGSKKTEIDDHNNEQGIDKNQAINGRNMSNVGIFRIYIEQYLRNHSEIRKDMTLMVRQMPPDEKGLPLQVYCFTNTVEWIEYERIQADIFDHILAATSDFGLKVFQNWNGQIAS